MVSASPKDPRLFVANRGEIALRTIRAAHSIGFETVLGVSVADIDSPAAREAGQVLVLGPAPARDSYLNENLVVHAALSSGATALHPGYGFLSERPELGELCKQAGLIFVGPESSSIRAVGDKLSAKKLAKSANVPLTRGSDKIRDLEHAIRLAEEIGYPVITKASAGGGGRGMMVARSADELTKVLSQAQATAREAFGDDTIYLEAFVESARHLEVQLMGDGRGGVVHFAERDCSIQRRYQKMIEEAPAPILRDEVRNKMHSAAVSLLSSIQYRNAGTVEFLYDVDREEFSFMEVNARIQVEHPVSEAITNTDLVKLQIALATGVADLPDQSSIKPKGHAIEARILAEDTERDFVPCPGRITKWHPATGPGIRVDSAVSEGTTVSPYYDSMIAKLIVHGESRDHAIYRLTAALDRFHVEGIKTNITLLQAIVAHKDFHNNTFGTRWLETTLIPEFQK